MKVEKTRIWLCSTVFVVATLFIVGCGLPVGSGSPKIVKSKDGRFQVTMPAGWSVQSDLNDEADIQVASPLKEVYLVVLSESKADFAEPTIEWHSEATRTAMLEGLAEGRIAAGPKQLQINGCPAVQYEIRGTAEGIKAVYLHTTVDTGEHLHQILAWTLASHYDRGLPALELVTKSLKAATPQSRVQN